MKSERRYDLDWLRVLAFSLLILFHTGMMFNTWGWHIKNNQTSEIFEYVMIFLSQWRMPLLFLISGAAIWFALDRYSARELIRLRNKRILLPLVFGMFFIIPPQVYYERLFQGESFASFFAFYQSVLEFVPYPHGNFSWHHLWYLPYIFIFALAAIPMFKYFKSVSGNKKLSRFMARVNSPMGLFVWVVPIVLSEIILRPYWPNNMNNLIDDWAQFSKTLMIFCFGFFLASHRPIWETIEKFRFRALAFGSSTAAFLYYVWYIGIEPFPGSDALYRTTINLNMWCWLLTILGFAHRHLNRNAPALKYANEAVYPFYILHQTVTVVLGFYLINWSASVGVKFLIVATGTFFGSWTIYEGLIKRHNFMRLLFGLKAKKSAKAKQQIEMPETAFSTVERG